MVYEIEIEWAVVCAARAAGWFVAKLDFVETRGAPDRMFIKDGRVVFIEFKRPGGRLSGIQKKMIRQLEAVGAEVHVAYSTPEAMRVLGLGDGGTA